MFANNSIFTSLIVALVLPLFISGCAVGPDYTKPEIQMPNQWHNKVVKEIQEDNSDLQTWWLLFDDPLLTSLIERSRKGNLDLQIAYDRIIESRARFGVAAGEYWPDVDAVGSYRRSKPSKAEGVALSTDEASFYSNGIDSSWEVDLFGRISRSVESAKASLEASEEDYRDVLVSLYSQVAQNYIDLRTQQARIHFAKQNVLAQKKTVELTKKRRESGLVPELDVQQSMLILGSTKSNIPQLYQEEIQIINRLSVLLGRYPSALHEELSTDTTIPKVPDQITSGLPTELLRQRPDIRQAERVLAAQTAEIGVATAALYPSFSLSGTFALEATKRENALDFSSKSWKFGPSVRWNLFDGNRIRSNIKVREALTKQAMTDYEQTILLALEEVENAMIAFEQEKLRLQAIRRTVSSAQKSVELVTELYEKGLTDFQNLLDMQRALTAQQDLLASSEGAVAKNLVRIYVALGGGWSFETSDIKSE